MNDSGRIFLEIINGGKKLALSRWIYSSADFFSGKFSCCVLLKRFFSNLSLDEMRWLFFIYYATLRTFQLVLKTLAMMAV